MYDLLNTEILFRAINSLNKFIYGLPKDEAENTLYYKFGFTGRLCWLDGQGRECNQPYRNGTLTQYIGITDKNKNKIFVGDIVNCNLFYEGSFLPHTGVIIYYPEYGSYATKNSDGIITLLYHIDFNSYKIIGNIFNNPDLL